jgi:hypothetical protein
MKQGKQPTTTIQNHAINKSYIGIVFYHTIIQPELEKERYNVRVRHLWYPNKHYGNLYYLEGGVSLIYIKSKEKA